MGRWTSSHPVDIAWRREQMSLSNDMAGQARHNDGPFGINAKNRPEDIERTAGRSFDPTYDGQAAVTFGGQLIAPADRAPTRPPVGIAAGSRVDISV